MLQTDTKLLLDDVNTSIAALDRDVHNESVIEKNMAFMKGLAGSDVPRRLLNEILASPDQMSTIAARSYEHVNHFSKIVLVDNPDPKGYRLTMHVWTRNQAKEAQKEELIHNHRFSFWSHIFCGQMKSQNFHEADAPSFERKDFRRYVYRPSTTGNIHSCNFDKDAQLVREPDTVVSRGDVYYLNYLTTHRVVFPKTEPCLCTFVLRGPRERDHSFTYNTFYPERGMESSVPMMSPEQLRQKLEFVLEVTQ
jgi:hypothetical protein